MTQTLNLTPEHPSGLNPAYPAPPRVDCIVLCLVGLTIKWLITQYSPAQYHDLLYSLVVDGWAFYLCRWIHAINPEARSPFWCDVYLVVQLSFAALSTHAKPHGWLLGLYILLVIASATLGIATIFLIKGDLEKHYNEREPIGLVLNGWLTFFFSFVYFQSHLSRIAKEKQAQSLAGLGPSLP
ncbi:MAG: hypothetical protein ABSA39_22495 [Edaphobacter sp.]|jgi:hypothetical protein